MPQFILDLYKWQDMGFIHIVSMLLAELKIHHNYYAKCAAMQVNITHHQKARQFKISNPLLLPPFPYPYSSNLPLSPQFQLLVKKWWVLQPALETGDHQIQAIWNWLGWNSKAAGRSQKVVSADTSCLHQCWLAGAPLLICSVVIWHKERGGLFWVGR